MLVGGHARRKSVKHRLERVKLPERILKIIKKYHSYMGVLKYGTSEEKELVSHYISDRITEMQEQNICD